jgi:hypothetical protein
LIRVILFDLTFFITVLPIDISLVRRGLKYNYKDFKNSLQMICAYSLDNIDGIVTRNIKDFKGCEISVYSPEELTKAIKH